MDEGLERRKRPSRDAAEARGTSVFDAPLLTDERGPTPWELWERREAQVDWRDFYASELKSELESD